jgi:hypothetical protein
MKRRHILLINLFFLGLMLFSAGVVYQFMTGTKPLAFIKSLGHHNSASVVETTACTQKAALKLSGAKAAPLVKLSQYQQACHSFVTDTAMVFVSMPMSANEAKDYALQDADMLKDFSKHGVRPLVIAEPTDQTGAQIDFAETANGSYNAYFQIYFQTLKAAGISDAQLGIWTPFPEANLPYWNNNQPQYFAPSVNNYVGTMHAVFPAAQTSVLLNSATYETTDFNWENGDYSSLLPYVKGITPGSINYAGLQGFPWVARQGGAGSILNGAEYLSPSLLSEMADSLGTKKVWFNTGTFGSKYTLDPASTVTMTPERRKAVLATVDTQALVLQKKGYQVAVNIFAQDKSKDSEETNWSYWSGTDPFSSTSTPVITDFINQLDSQNISFWLFDK